MARKKAKTPTTRSKAGTKKPASKPGTSRTRAVKPAQTRAGNPPPKSLLDDMTQLLASLGSRPPNPITPCMDLKHEVRIADDEKRALSNSLQKMARRFNKRARITDDECGDLELVEDVHKLVATKAGFTFEKECKTE